MADSGPGGGGGGDVEAAKDPGALKSHSSITDAEMMGEIHTELKVTYEWQSSPHLHTSP